VANIAANKGREAATNKAAAKNEESCRIKGITSCPIVLERGQ